MAHSTENNACTLGLSFSATLTLFSVFSNLIGAGAYDLNLAAMSATAAAGTPLLGCLFGCCLGHFITKYSLDKNSDNEWGDQHILTRDAILWVGCAIPSFLGALLGRAFLPHNQTLKNIPFGTQAKASALGNAIFFIVLSCCWSSFHISAYFNNKEGKPGKQPLVSTPGGPPTNQPRAG
jgi:hypothetical protein